MRKNLYPRLAAQNMRKNRQTYLPYLFTCIGTVMMFYIMLTLESDPALKDMSGGSTLSATLFFGCIIIGIFAVILIFYANSFIIKQRKKEFGLYNILGMEKRHIGRMLAWETLYSAIIAYVLGIGFGILFSKLLQLALFKILKFDVHFGLYISPEVIGLTIAIFAAIFVLTLLNDLRIIHLSKPVELLHGTQEGEREPKSKWILAIAGVICLGAGYAMSIMTRTAVGAVSLFFVAVLFVIAGTYLLFTAFSIVFLKKLRANKKFYYQTRHFATVSGMLYRMKRNAGGLASICILSTMVLVTVSTTVCLYTGVNDMLEAQYPTEGRITCYSINDRTAAEGYKQMVADVAKEQGREISNLQGYMSLEFAGHRTGSKFTAEGTAGLTTDMGMCMINCITLPDYNAMTGQNVTLNSDEILLYCADYMGNEPVGSQATIVGINYNVKTIDSFPMEPSSIYMGFEQYCIVLADDTALHTLEQAQANSGKYGGAAASYIVSYDLDGTSEEINACEHAIAENLKGDDGITSMLSSRSQNYSDFISIYGGLFFLGLFLGLLFLMATVLIIYYKQVTEGYDDRERFTIMQNVGMTKDEVKKTIHTQVLIVFFLPLAAAIIHIAFAFPMIRRMLSLFALTNITLFVICTLVTIAVFAVLYTLVYSLTAKTYYKIVS